jgi:hypothetical protein
MGGDGLGPGGPAATHAGGAGEHDRERSDPGSGPDASRAQPRPEASTSAGTAAAGPARIAAVRRGLRRLDVAGPGAPRSAHRGGEQDGDDAGGAHTPAPDLRTARRLVAASGTGGMRVTILLKRWRHTTAPAAT